MTRKNMPIIETYVQDQDVFCISGLYHIFQLFNNSCHSDFLAKSIPSHNVRFCFVRNARVALGNNIKSRDLTLFLRSCQDTSSSMQRWRVGEVVIYMRCFDMWFGFTQPDPVQIGEIQFSTPFPCIYYLELSYDSEILNESYSVYKRISRGSPFKQANQAPNKSRTNVKKPLLHEQFASQLQSNLSLTLFIIVNSGFKFPSSQ